MIKYQKVSKYYDHHCSVAERLSTNKIALTDIEPNNSKPLNREEIRDLPLLGTLKNLQEVKSKFLESDRPLF